MVETTTLHYGWTKPELAHSASTWGGFLNTDLDSIDALVYANQQGIVPIGSITMFAGATAPANWLLCNGSALDTTAYAGLFAVLGYAYGGSGTSFNLPNLTQKFPMGAGTLAATGGEATHTLTAAELAAHTHTATQAAHTHAATQAAHTHADSGHGHAGTTASDSGTHAHGSNLMRFVGSGGTLGVGVTPNNVTSGNTDPGSAPGVTVNIGSGFANLNSQAPAITVPSQTPAITVAANTGGGAAHNNLPPFLTVNFIIRAV